MENSFTEPLTTYLAPLSLSTKMAQTYVKVKYEERLLKLRPDRVSVSNLAMIFKLQAQHGIYIFSEEEAEIILPTDNGLFEVEDFWKTYVVSGEPAVTVPTSHVAQSPSTSLGIPISYQQPARGKHNPPPAAGHGNLERPTFKANKSQGWKKSFVVIGITSSGHVFDKYQVYLQLKEETASVQAISDMLKQQLGFDVCLIDSKRLPIMAGEATTGKRRPAIFKIYK